MDSETCADMVLLNGKIITVDSNDTIAEAVAVKDKKIIYTGDSEGIKSLIGEKTKRIDLKGKTVLPGFIDAHTHMELIANNLFWLDVHSPPLKSVEEILKKIEKKVQQTPKGEWVVGQGGFVQPMPTKGDLDAVAPEHPVVLRSSMHRYILNSKALELAGITSETPDPSGGEIDRDPTTGEPTGILKECYHMLPINPYPYEELKEAIKKICYEKFIQQGVTTIYTLPATSDSIRIYQELLKHDELPLRLRVIVTINSSAGTRKITDLDCLLKLGLQTGFGNDWLKFGGIKIFVDGEDSTAAFYDPSGQTKKWRGLLKLTQEELTKSVVEAHKAGIQVWLHAIGDKALDMALDAIEIALKEMPKKDHRHRIEHAGIERCTSEHLKRMKRLGIIPVPTSAWIYLGSDVPKETNVYIYRSILDHGLLPPGNSDSAGAMPESINPLFGIWCAVSRKTHTGKLMCPEERLTVMEAIRMYTINSAYAGFEEKTRGSIEIGKLADLAVLSDDPLTLLEIDKIKDINVEMTIINGKIVYEKQK
ncbi:MAG: amidohydrolase [Candidatus Bathyarchaeota archaeon]|nr:amidohydrolase [Candidatus Bathyarchaeota archaeon]MDH5746143.1 amidohydrolase [Candidatus Bathyarchaeota archaeon]